jgi:DNA-binding transcriptional ArsR family regulator
MPRRSTGKGELREKAMGFGLLSDPTRLGILATLAKGPQNVTSICEALGLKQPTVSHHLKLLRMERLVRSSRQGKSVVYETEASGLRALGSAVDKLKPKK